MEKIIAAFDGLQYSKSTQQYALELACNVKDRMLTGVFMDDFTRHNFRLFDMVGSQGVPSNLVEELLEKDNETRKESVKTFIDACTHAKVETLIHHDRSIAIHELVKESIYADLLLISQEEKMSHFDEAKPTQFIRDVLMDVQCPVMLVPSTHHPIEKVVILYDGEPSSVYAAKMFNYVLPEFRSMPQEIVYARDYDKDESSIMDQRLVKEFIRSHYPSAKTKILKGDPEAELVDYLEEQEQSIVVLGAYRRGMVSRFFKPSMADVLMKNTKSPLFIAHFK